MTQTEMEFVKTQIALAVKEGLDAHVREATVDRNDAIAAAIRLHLAECPTAIAATKSKAYLAGMITAGGAVGGIIMWLLGTVAKAVLHP